MINKLMQKINEELNELRKEGLQVDKIKDRDVLYHTYLFLKDYENNVEILRKANKERGVRIFDTARENEKNSQRIQ